MTSERLQADISAHIDGELPKEQAEKLQAHIAKTPEAKQEEEELRQVVSQVQALEPIPAPKDFAAGVMGRVNDLVAARAARAMRPRRRRRRPPDPFANDPFANEAGAKAAPDGFGPDPMCTPFAEDISAALDGELTPEQEQKLYAHLRSCAACRALQRHLFEVSDLVQALPRIATPLGFMTKITDRLDAERLEETRANLRLHHERRVWLTRLGRLAQAACFLLVAGGALALTTPDERPLARLAKRSGARTSTASPWTPRFNRRAEGKKQKRRADSVVADLPGGKFDAVVELEARELEKAQSATRSLLQGYRIEREVAGDKDGGFVVQIPADAIDKFSEGLRRNDKVETPKAEAEALNKIHTEYDQVLLQNGFVLVGTSRERDDGTILLTVGDRVYEIDKADVAKIEPAKSKRRVKIVLRRRN